MLHPKEAPFETGYKIAGVAGVVSGITLSLLQDIDNTLDSLSRVALLLNQATSELSVLADVVSTKAVVLSAYIDEDDTAVNLLEKSIRNLKDALPMLVRKRKAIGADNRLHGHHCDALHDAYENTIDEVATLIDASEKVRHAIITHDLKAEPRDSKVFGNVTTLLSDLH